MATNDRFCDSCGGVNRNTAKFCKACGETMAPMPAESSTSAFSASPPRAFEPPRRSFDPPPPVWQPQQSGGFAPLLHGAVQGLPPGVAVANPWARFGSYLLEGILMFFTLYIGWFIWAAVASSKGQTPAKQLLNHRVISVADKRPVGFGTMFFMRGMVGGLVVPFCIVFTLGIIIFMPFWDSQKQNLWDKLSSTQVVVDPRNAWQM